jgi:hypothetical protein
MSVHRIQDSRGHLATSTSKVRKENVIRERKRKEAPTKERGCCGYTAKDATMGWLAGVGVSEIRNGIGLA